MSDPRARTPTPTGSGAGRRRRPPVAAAVVLLALVGACAGVDGAGPESPTPSPGSSPATDALALRGTLDGGGASFPQAFYEEAIAGLAERAPHLTINYGGGGSGKGRQDLIDGLIDFAGSDSPLKDDERRALHGEEILYFPTVLAPITISYNLAVDDLRLSPATIAAIFQRRIRTWDDPAIAADNPGVALPRTAITVVHRADGSGTTTNFSKFLDAACGSGGDGSWTLGSGSQLEWPAGTQAGQGNGGVAQIVLDTPGAIGYVDLSDGRAAGLTFARVRNKAGVYVGPTLEATTTAAGGVAVADDLTFFAGWADGEGAYPVAAQTWILVRAEQDEARTAANLRAWLRFVLTDGQDLAAAIDYARLPPDLAAAALDRVELIHER